MSASLLVLNARFNTRESYRANVASPYKLLPFRFTRLGEQRYLLTNFVGEYTVLPRHLLEDFVRHRLTAHSDTYNDLKSQHFLADAESSIHFDLLATKYRTKCAPLTLGTSLFMFVVTLRCEHSCSYCQVSRAPTKRSEFDMSTTTADRAIDFMFSGPSKVLKVEFQGGEPLLNFDIIKYIVRTVEERNRKEQRNIAFVITSNLSLLTDEHLAFFREHDVGVSTSLDGPPELHNKNRPRPGNDSHERVVNAMARVRSALGTEKLSALMTTTEASLTQPEAIIDEYVRQGFPSIFLRSISPYGFAVKTKALFSYSTANWLDFYRRGLDHILRLNRKGIPFREDFATIILGKMLTPYGTRYVDLQSPSGIGISALVFNYDGDIYASDEARMLAEMGDKTFRLGNLGEHSYEQAMTSEALWKPIRESMTESAPMCADCGVQPFCGADPVYHHARQGDWVGFKPDSGFCEKTMGVVKHLVTLMEENKDAANTLRSWIGFV